ncbi:MAG: 50S ribosome-binding GTPase [Actinomycetota bacterium]|nr:50S ribosome-binding GTPase [Actinomycetota bacterium]
MRDDIIGLVPMIDQTLADCLGVVDERSLEPVAHMRNRLVARLAYPDDVLLAALAGGTGSGKSSLFNAVAGADVAATGGVRPTTSHPQALVPESRASALSGYLAAVGIDDRVPHEGHDWLCLIDLPDTDSVEIDHRQRVDSLLPQIDCVVWVVDPEKYRDAALHHGYLRPMAAHQSQFVFVLNQSDRLEDEEVSQVKADLRAALVEDGIEGPTVLTTAARPVAGPPLGVEALLDHLREELGGSVGLKLLVDLQTGCAALLEAPGAGPGVGFETRWMETVDEVIARVDSDDRSGAGEQVATFLEDVAAETGGPLAMSIGEIAAQAPSVVLLGAGPAGPQSSDAKPRKWWQRSGSATPSVEAADTGSAGVRASLESEVGDPIRAILAKKARAQASISELVLAVNDLTRRSGR